MTITKHIAMLLMTLVGLMGLLNGQTSTSVKAQIPFAFVANGKTMPAGECTIEVVVNGRTLAVDQQQGAAHLCPSHCR